MFLHGVNFSKFDIALGIRSLSRRIGMMNRSKRLFLNVS